MSDAPLPDGPARDALHLACATLAAAERGGRAFETSAALADIARAYAGLGALSSAEACFEQALLWARHAGSHDHVVDLLGHLCETAAGLADTHEAAEPGSGHPALERARGHAFEASTMACRVADPAWEAKVLLRISDVLDRCGDRDDAVQLQTRALRLMSGSLSEGAPDPALLPGLGRLADD